MNKVHTDKIMLSNRVSFGRRYSEYFIGYKDDDKVNALCVIF